MASSFSSQGRAKSIQVENKPTSVTIETAIELLESEKRFWISDGKKTIVVDPYDEETAKDLAPYLIKKAKQVFDRDVPLSIKGLSPNAVDNCEKSGLCGLTIIQRIRSLIELMTKAGFTVEHAELINKPSSPLTAPKSTLFKQAKPAESSSTHKTPSLTKPHGGNI